MAQEPTRWCMNTKTGNVKPWNESMIGIDNIVETDRDGTPIELAKYLKKAGRVKPAAEPPVVEVGPVKADTETVSGGDFMDDMDVEDGDDEEGSPDVAEIIQAFSDSTTKDNLLLIADREGLGLNATDRTRTKLWIAEQIMKNRGTI